MNVSNSDSSDSKPTPITPAYAPVAASHPFVLSRLRHLADAAQPASSSPLWPPVELTPGIYAAQQPPSFLSLADCPLAQWEHRKLVNLYIFEQILGARRHQLSDGRWGHVLGAPEPTWRRKTFYPLLDSVVRAGTWTAQAAATSDSASLRADALSRAAASNPNAMPTQTTEPRPSHGPATGNPALISLPADTLWAAGSTGPDFVHDLHAVQSAEKVVVAAGLADPYFVNLLDLVRIDPAGLLAPHRRPDEYIPQDAEDDCDDPFGGAPIPRARFRTLSLGVHVLRAPAHRRAMACLMTWQEAQANGQV